MLRQRVEGGLGGAGETHLRSAGGGDFASDGLGHDVVGPLHHVLEALVQRRGLDAGHRDRLRRGRDPGGHGRAEAIRQRLGDVARRGGAARDVAGGGADPRTVEHGRFHGGDVAGGDVVRIPAVQVALPRPRGDVHRDPGVVLPAVGYLGGEVVEGVLVEPDVAGGLEHEGLAVRAGDGLSGQGVVGRQGVDRGGGGEHFRGRGRGQRRGGVRVPDGFAGGDVGDPPVDRAQHGVVGRGGQGGGQGLGVDRIRRLLRHRQQGALRFGEGVGLAVVEAGVAVLDFYAEDGRAGDRHAQHNGHDSRRHVLCLHVCQTSARGPGYDVGVPSFS